MSECTRDCSACGAECAERKAESLLAPGNARSRVGKVIAVMSGKGGVGKSLVTGLLAVLCRRGGGQAAILDADITGPSIPRMFGIRGRAMGCGDGILPAESRTGIRIMSLNLLLEKESDPVVWRGSLVSGTARQFWTDVVWGEVDCMFVDMPPGTGDVPLTVFQSLPVDGIIVVTSPQELVGMIVEKAVNMAAMMGIPVLGMVENMSWVSCPGCGRKIRPFGEGGAERAAREHGIPLLARLPLDPGLARACDAGLIELFNEDWMDPVWDAAERCPGRGNAE